MKQKIIFYLTSFLFVFIFGANSQAQTPPTKKPTPTYQTMVVQLDDEWGQLVVLNKGQQYSIDKIRYKIGMGMIGLGNPQTAQVTMHKETKPIIEPQSQTLLYVSMNGCGYERDGTIIFASDLRGQNKRAILGSCNLLSFHSVKLMHEGKRYALIEEANTGVGVISTWVYDFSNQKLISRIKGCITLENSKMYSISEPGCHSDSKNKNPINISNILQKKAPLNFMPLGFTHLKVNNSTALLLQSEGSGSCGSEIEAKREIILKNQKLLILSMCKNYTKNNIIGYEVYYKGQRGMIRVTDIQGGYSLE